MINKILVFILVGGLAVASTYGQTTFATDGVNYKVTSAENRTVEIALSSCYDVAGGAFAPTTISNGGTDYTITNIVNDAFKRCMGLTSVTLPNSITSIGSNAFTVCQNLTSVILPNSITSIGISAFNLCTNLTNITLPNTLMRLEQGTFESCTSLTSITLPNTLISIGVSVFRDSGLTSITLPSSITSIEGDAFRGCTSLATVSINKAIPLTIVARVFHNLTLGGLTLKVPTGSLAAYNAKAVWSTFGTKTEIDFEFTNAGVNYLITNTEAATVGIIKRRAGVADTCFTGDFALTEVTDNSIDYDITSIATAAFEGCTGLTAFTFPDNNNFTSVAEAVFKGCTSLATVTLPNSSIASIGNNAFENCTGLATFSINKVVPLVINANVFEGVTLGGITLKVPMAGVSAYEGADVWEDFGTTQILNTESHVKENAFSIAIHNDRLEITQEDRALKINRVQIINLLGQVVKTSKKNSIALSNLPVGVYIVSVYTKNGRFSKKFVRE